jgi:hypothetical protein
MLLGLRQKNAYFFLFWLTFAPLRFVGLSAGIFVKIFLFLVGQKPDLQNQSQLI